MQLPFIQQFRVILSIAAFLFILLAVGVGAQTVVDKTVATVSDGVRTELITFSDLRWQLSLQPNVSLASATSEDYSGHFNC